MTFAAALERAGHELVLVRPHAGRAAHRRARGRAAAGALARRWSPSPRAAAPTGCCSPSRPTRPPAPRRGWPSWPGRGRSWWRCRTASSTGRWSSRSPAAPTVLPAVIWVPAEVVAPGRVRQRGPVELTVPDGDAGRALAQLLGGGVTLTSEFAAVAWRKLAVNAVAGLMVLARRRAGMFARPDVLALARAYAEEVFAVARAEGADAAARRRRGAAGLLRRAAARPGHVDPVRRRGRARARVGGAQRRRPPPRRAARDRDPGQRRRGAPARRRVRPDGIIRFMDPWVIWLIAAVIFAVGEIATLGFFLAPFAGGALRRRARVGRRRRLADLAGACSCSSRACCSPRCARSRSRTGGCRRSCARAPRPWSAGRRW